MQELLWEGSGDGVVACEARIPRGGTSVDKGSMADGSMPCWRSRKKADVTEVLQSVTGARWSQKGQ